MNPTRRDLGKLALAALPAARLLAKTNSNFGGVQIGINAPYSFHGAYNSGDECLDALVKLNLSSVELRAQPIEQFMGARPDLVAYPAPRRGGGGTPKKAPDGGATPAADAGTAPPKKTGGRAPLTPEQQAARKADAEELRKWRLAASMDKVKAFRKKYEDAGVKIDIVKVDAIDTFSDEEIDYMFGVARTAGARAISCEIPLSHTRRLGMFGEKHKMMIGYHGHTDVTSPEAFGRPESWETAMSYSKYNGINLDIGHFTAGNSTSPIPFLQKYHDRITHIHIKDRMMHNGPNVPWGTGETPIRETLKLMQKEKYPFVGVIEFEYQVPQGSDQMTEIAKCVAFCKNALA
ncbi:MAG TPA: TIM barrel protein [Bryobacteraceae bacterium]|nr:TIM barrel protein [Bryobacteraceae bacterium]